MENTTATGIAVNVMLNARAILWSVFTPGFFVRHLTIFSRVDCFTLLKG